MTCDDFCERKARTWFLLVRMENKLAGLTEVIGELSCNIAASVEDLRKTLPKAQVKDGLLVNMTGRIDSWLKENGLVK